MQPGQAETVIAEMAAQRAKERSGDAQHYKLRKACAVRAVDLYQMLNHFRARLEVDILLREIEHDAQ